MIYTRVSSRDQYENNFSIEVQDKYCRSHAERKGYKIVKFFGGTYESAKSDTERRVFSKMIKYVKKSRNISYILVYSFDRFSRTGNNAGKLTEELAERGVYVISVTQDINTDSPSGQLQKNIFLMFSAFDNQQRRARTVSGMRELLRRGYWTFECPTGYTDLNKHSSADKRRIVLSEDGHFIQKAFQLKLKGMRAIDIAKYLKELGYKITFKKLHKIFNNPFYAGFIVSKMIPGEVVEGNHEALVDPKDFLKIHNIMLENQYGKDARDNHSSLYLKNFMICTKCNEPITGHKIVKKNSGKAYYYKCRKQCRNNRKDSIVNANFIAFLSQYQVDPQFKELLLEMMEIYFEKLNQDKSKEIELLKSHLTQLNTKIEKMEDVLPRKGLL